MPARSFARWIAASLALIVCAGASIAIRAQKRTALVQQAQDIGVMDALDLYELGDPAVIAMVATPRQVGSIQEALTRDGRAWIRAHGKDEEPRRRLVATTFALEAVRHSIDTYEVWPFLLLLRWAGDEWRSDSKPSPNELLWRKAEIGLIQSVGYFKGVSDELSAARDRFPKEPRWALVKAWLAEFAGRPRPSPPLEHIAEVAPSIIQAYVDASVLPDVSAEAHVHLAYLFTSKNENAAAVDHAEEAVKRSAEPDIQSLAHLIRGWALTRAGRSTDALAAFRDAHNILPASQSAALWFSDALFLSGDRHEATLVVDDTLRAGLGELDPWRLYPRGDFRLWPRLIVQLREAWR